LIELSMTAFEIYNIHLTGAWPKEEGILSGRFPDSFRYVCIQLRSHRSIDYVSFLNLRMSGG